MKMATKLAMYDEMGDVLLVGTPASRYLGLMFAIKPASTTAEFDELSRAFDRGTLAMLFDRDPDTVGRWRKARRVPHTVEAVVDRFWWVMHVACAERQWSVDAARYFLLSIEPELGRRPAELVRESDEQARLVARLIAERRAADAPGPIAAQESTAAVPGSPFAQLLAHEPDDDGVFARAYRMPSLAGRARPIGGVQEDADPFRVRYSATNSHAIPLGASAVKA
jgi:hypothetical protein